MKLRLFWCLLVLASSVPAWAAPYRPNLDRLDDVPLHVLPAPKVAEALSHTGSRKDGPLIFAGGIDFPLSLQDGLWTEAGDMAIWRSRVSSVGATLMLLQFERFALPKSAELYLYDPDGTVVQGPITASDRTSRGELWTPFVRGDQLVVELRVAKSRRAEVDLKVGMVYHGFVNVLKDGLIPKSGSCNIDVVCPQGDDWSGEIRSVVRVQIPVSRTLIGLCTGTLINNVRQDARPLILSANHCEYDADNAEGLVTYWNFQNSSCGGAPDGSESQTLTGATFLAADEESDFALLELNDTPPDSFKPYLAGWYVGNDVADSGVTIHHPSGDEKSISLFGSSPSRVRVDIVGREVETWEIFWAQGTTEQGSSGASLWNQNHRVVGVLTGGAASCDALDSPDYFGRLELAWTHGLQAYLDPDDTGTKTLCGTTPGTVCGTNSGEPEPEPEDGGGGAGSLLFLAGMGAAALARRRFSGRRACRA